MKVFELSKEFGITNKELIDFLKSKDFKVASHSQNLSDEMIDVARSEFAKSNVDEKENVKEKEPKKAVAEKKVFPAKSVKTFSPNDMILCRSLVPWNMEAVGADMKTLYKWPGFGDIEYVAYKDLQSWRRKSMIMDGKIFIEDPDICEQWKNELGKCYKNYVGIDYPEEFFDKPDDEFEAMLKDASPAFKEVIKYTAYDMIRNENYPSLKKIVIIDNILGTGIKEFL